MRAGVNFFVGLMGWSATAAAVTLFPVAALAQTSGDAARAEGTGGSGTERANDWVPSFAVISGVTVQDWNATVKGTRIPSSGPSAGVPEDLRPPQRGDGRDVTPYVGGNLELMTPALPLPTSPRLFVGGDVAAEFGTERRVAHEGDPSAIRSPVPPASQGSATFSEGSALGQGSKTTGEVDTLVYGAHVGVAFPAEVRGHRLRIKPSFGWMRYEVDVSGLIVDAECFDVLQANGGCEPFLGGFLREQRFAASGSETLDGIGPGLDVEMDTGRVGPLGTSIFVGARLYRLLGNTTVDLQPLPQSYDDPLGQGTSSARFTLDVDRWMYRVGLGFRLQWRGWE